MLHIEVFSIHIVSVFSHLQVAHTKIEGQPMKRLKSSPCKDHRTALVKIKEQSMKRPKSSPYKDHTLEKVYFPETS